MAEEVGESPWSARLLLCSSLLLLSSGLLFSACYALSPSGLMLQQLMFVMFCMAFVIGSLAWMALSRCHRPSDSELRRQNCKTCRRGPELVWASMLYGALQKDEPRFQLMQVATGPSGSPSMKAIQKASVLPVPKWEQPTCLFCLEDFSDADAIAMLPCGHVFHEACAVAWLAAKRTCSSCPVCRESPHMV